jgi:putative polyketide hydroxylase
LAAAWLRTAGCKVHGGTTPVAYVLAGHAAPALLETYEAERGLLGQFTIEQAYTRHVRRTAPRLGVDEAPPLAPDFDVELGYPYRSRATLSARRRRSCPRRSTLDARSPGLPCASWVEVDGRRSSTIDIAANTFTVLVGADDLAVAGSVGDG